MIFTESNPAVFRREVSGIFTFSLFGRHQAQLVSVDGERALDSVECGLSELIEEGGLAVAHLLKKSRVDDFFRSLCTGRTVFGLTEEEDGQFHLASGDEWDPDRFVLGTYRSIEPLKTLFFPPRERVWSADSDSPIEPSLAERIVIGVKSCDLSALKIHDYVFRDTDPVDPFYAEAREKTILVSCDCTDPADVCFCTLVREQPYPEAGYDINLSPVDSDYVVETGSDRGEALVEEAEQFLEQADGEILKSRDAARDRVASIVGELVSRKHMSADMDLTAAVRNSSDSSLWDDFATDCVECGACNFVCCTCHCFFLANGLAQNETPETLKQWDSCLYRNFARVAGGANPRNHRAERLYNRFDKKFSFFPEVLETYACDGCGRCIEACTGNIDIRDVLKRAVDES